MRYVLNLAYLALLVATCPWWLHAAIWRGKYREGYRAKLFGRVPQRSGSRPCIWLHAVSVGEVNLLQPLVDRLPEFFPGWDCCISTTTKTGFDLARRKYADHPVFYCPLDFSWSVSEAIRRVKPDLLVLAELELWPNLIAAARRSGARVAIVNGRLGDQSARGYRRVAWLVGPLLRKLDLIAVQNDEYAQRFLQLGALPQAVCVTGSMKFDGAETDRENPRTQALARLAGFDQRDVVFLAGSTQHPEESLALEAYLNVSRRYPRLRLVLIPRHPARFDEVARLLEKAAVPWQRRTDLRETAEATPTSPGSVLLVDTVGELAAWWGCAQVAFVGGSMGARGGQNMIEPAGYGAAVCFGPRTRNFRDVVRMLREAEGAVVVHDGSELQAFLERCLQDPEWAAQLGTRARQLVATQLGASERTLRRLAALAAGRRGPIVEHDPAQASTSSDLSTTPASAAGDPPRRRSA